MGCGPSKQQQEATTATATPQYHAQPTPKPTAAPTKVSAKLSPIYKKLPAGAQKHAVRNVYDGDTLTLVDERRVRFLGIDTPELKEKQPYAEEAKAYTKERCHKKDIWLVIDGQDHYGRLLAHVFVETSSSGGGGGGYELINEGLVEQGFAYAYIPNKNEKPFNWDKLLALQAQARKQKRGVWKDFKDETVYATVNGSAYHQNSCTHLSKSKNLKTLQVSEATDLGLHPCRTCMA